MFHVSLVVVPNCKSLIQERGQGSQSLKSRAKKIRAAEPLVLRYRYSVKLGSRATRNSAKPKVSLLLSSFLGA